MVTSARRSQRISPLPCAMSTRPLQRLPPHVVCGPFHGGCTESLPCESSGARRITYNRRVMKNATLLLSLLVSALLASCAGVSPTRIIGDTVGAAGGALIGNKLSNGNPLITAASAGGGVLLSESLQAGSKASANKAYDAGYEKARSDSAKQQFQTLIDRQRTGPQLDDRAHVRLLDVPLPERQENGVILAPSTATIRIQE